MHIEHKQFLELVAEAAGYDIEKAEKQLTDLISDIQQSLSDEGAYEIEGFGIFSKLGNRIMFIPSDELETEVNFKYVGMEPIELDEPKPVVEEDPFEGLDEADQHTEDVDSRFAGLIDDDIIADTEPPSEEVEEEGPGPEMWGVEAHKEDDGADRLFASLMGEEYEEPLDESEGIDTSDTNDSDDFTDVFAELEEPESSEDLGAEVASFMNEEPVEAPENEIPTDDLLDDIFADSEDQDDFEDLIQESIEETVDEETVEEESSQEEVEEQSVEDEIIEEVLELESAIDPDDEDSEDDELIESIDELVDEQEEVQTDSEETEEIELEGTDDFDDPFLVLEDDQVDEADLNMPDLDDSEIIPVIKNITTDVPDTPKVEKKEKEEKPKKEKKEKVKKEKPKKEPKESQPAPAWLWVVLILVVVGGSVAGLGYFSILNIPFITPQTSSSTTTVITTPAQSPVSEPVEQPVTSNNEVETETVNPEMTPEPVQEQPSNEVVEQPQPINNPVSETADQYGLRGEVSASGVDGYTIILYTLSNQQNAFNERQKLTDAGFRSFLVPIPSERFGTLYRVCVGQFGSLFDAAVAAEEIEDLLPENYIIKKIN